jgi:hypothetical protein
MYQGRMKLLQATCKKSMGVVRVESLDDHRQVTYRGIAADKQQW